MEANREALAGHILSLRRYAMSLTGRPEEADDLVQECLTRALARARANNRIQNLRAYLFTILHNLWVDEIARKRGNGTHISLDLVDWQIMTPPGQSGAVIARDLASALQQLPEQQRAIVLLVGLEGLTYREASEVLSIPIGTVMSRLSRGRQALRRLIDGDGQAGAAIDQEQTKEPAVR